MVRQSPLLSFFRSRNLVMLEDIELVSTEIFGLFQLLTEDDDTNSSKSSKSCKRSAFCDDKRHDVQRHPCKNYY
ncbi:unnamed protein product [Peronospora belbahrii]|uniref:Uncharacterized protein n=1 Tax=Peronospora belbahrii TaxID=622444 RepID=A0ABN8D326_9STRA|nr:unnamed protein product [Peronospora belbahrii]